MLDFKKVLIFIGSFLIIFTALNWLVPNLGLDKWSNKKFVEIGNNLYGNYKDKAKVSFKKVKPSEKPIFEHPFKKYDDVVVTKIMSKSQIAVATDRARRMGGTSIQVNHAEFFTDVWNYVWIPLILLLSLILATPVPVKRRLLAFFLGIFAMVIFIGFKFWIRFVVEINRHGWLELGTQGPTMKQFFVYLNTAFLYIGASLMAAIIIWAIVTFRKGDHLRFMKKIPE